LGVADLPFHLLDALASRDEQVRFIYGGTKDEYLVPEELLNDAHHFCERARREGWPTFSKGQQDSIQQLEFALAAVPDEVLASETIVDDEPWVATMQRAGDVLRAFGRNVPL